MRSAAGIKSVENDSDMCLHPTADLGFGPLPFLPRVQQEATCKVICLRTVARYPDGLKRNRANRLAQIRPVDMGKHSYRARLKTSVSSTSLRLLARTARRAAGRRSRETFGNRNAGVTCFFHRRRSELPSGRHHPDVK